MSDRRIERWELGKSDLFCPLCLHPKSRHSDGLAQQSLNAMGCTSCAICELNRQTLTERVPCGTATPQADEQESPDAYRAHPQFGAHP